MHVAEIEPHRASLLLRVSPRARLVGTLVLLAGIALLPRRPTLLYLVPAAVVLLLWVVSRMPLRYAIRRLLVVEWFVLGIAMLSLLRPEAFPLFASTIIKSNLCVVTLLLLTWSTAFPELLQALRSLRLPPVMLTTLALMYRYLPVLTEELRRMQRARASRTFTRRRFPAWQDLSMILARLFARSAERAERIYLAMCARGWK